MDKAQLAITIGKNLAKYRIQHNLTQDQMAEKAGLSYPYYCNIERGTRTPSMLTFLSIAENLPLSVSELLCDPNETQDDPEAQKQREIENLSLLLEQQSLQTVKAISKSLRIFLEALQEEG